MPVYHASYTSLTNVTSVEFEIDVHSKTPAYQQLAARLRDAINAGEYGPRQAIPSMRRLVQETDLAPGTVEKAIRVLEAEGLIYTVRGRGTFVR